MTPEEANEIQRRNKQIRRRTRLIDDIVGNYLGNGGTDPEPPVEPPEPPVEPPEPPQHGYHPLGPGVNIALPMTDQEGRTVNHLMNYGQVSWPIKNNAFDPTFIEQMNRFSFDTLRLNIPPARFDLAFHPSGSYFDPFDRHSREMLAIAVREAGNLGWKIILDPHHGADFNSNPSFGDNRWASYTRWYEEVGNQYSDIDYVYAESGNELYGGRPAQWGPQANVDKWQGWVSRFDNFLEANGWPAQRRMHGLMNWQQDILALGDTALRAFIQSFPGVVWDWHNYGALPGSPSSPPVRLEDEGDYPAFLERFQSALGRIRDAGIRVHMGELGYDWNLQRQSAPWSWHNERAAGQYAMTVRNTFEIVEGFSVWHGTEARGWNLYPNDTVNMVKGDQSAVSEFGQLVIDRP